jgi:hypothetical protein
MAHAENPSPEMIGVNTIANGYQMLWLDINKLISGEKVRFSLMVSV